MDTLLLCSVNRILNGLNIHNDTAVVAGPSAQASVARVIASSWRISEYKLEIYDDYSLTFCHCNSRFLLAPAGALTSNASGAAGLVDVIYWKSLCYYSNSFLLWRCDPTRVMASSFLRFLDHTQDVSQSVGFLWTSDQLVAETSAWQHTTLTTDKHQCPRWDSNLRSQQASGRRPRDHWDRPYYSTRSLE
jgi:hypothetical protein